MGLSQEEEAALHEVLTWGVQVGNNPILRWFGPELQDFDEGCRKLMTSFNATLPEGSSKCRIRYTARECKTLKDGCLGESLGDEATGMVTSTLLPGAGLIMHYYIGRGRCLIGVLKGRAWDKRIADPGHDRFPGAPHPLRRRGRVRRDHRARPGRLQARPASTRSGAHCVEECWLDAARCQRWRVAFRFPAGRAAASGDHVRQGQRPALRR